MNDVHLTLKALEVLTDDGRTSQRALSRKLGVSLGHTNLIVKRMARQGLIKLKTIPGNRVLYALTPKGVAEKLRKTYDWVRLSHAHLRRARGDLRGRLEGLRRQGPRRVACLGYGELFELALLAAVEADLKVVVLIDPDLKDTRRICGVPVLPSAEGLPATVQGAIRLRPGIPWDRRPLVDLCGAPRV